MAGFRVKIAAGFNILKFSIFVYVLGSVGSSGRITSLQILIHVLQLCLNIYYKNQPD